MGTLGVNATPIIVTGFDSLTVSEGLLHNKNLSIFILSDTIYFIFISFISLFLIFLQISGDMKMGLETF
ncbi:hypothetical protein, partial [Escherichia coli]|uniref:hypothetical protein n=1 Tax=Escherichia coli TaxID=562 RepID=UPI00307A785A